MSSIETTAAVGLITGDLSRVARLREALDCLRFLGRNPGISTHDLATRLEVPEDYGPAVTTRLADLGLIAAQDRDGWCLSRFGELLMGLFEE